MVLEGNAHDRARVVRRYLSALDASKVGRSQAKTAESLVFRMHQIDTELLSADPVARLHLTQERIDLHAEHLRLLSGNEQVAELEKAFVRVARAYGERHDITYSAWRQIGVESDVLTKAGILPHKNNRSAAKDVSKEAKEVAAPAVAPAVVPAPVAEEPAAPVEEPAAEVVAVKKAPGKKKAVAKKAPAAAKAATAKKNGATRVVKKTATGEMPAEAHLLS